MFDPGATLVELGATNERLAVALVIVKLCVMADAALNIESPTWLADTVQVPAASMVTLVPETEQTDGVVEEKAGVRPDVEVAASEIGVVLNVVLAALTEVHDSVWLPLTIGP